MNEAQDSESALTSVGEVQQRRYDESYFSVYRGDAKRQEMYRSERDRIEVLMPSGRILDVGCGLGGFLQEFDSEKWDRYGTDVADLAIKEARMRGIKVKEFAEAYAYPEEFFNVIVFRGSLQLIPTPFSVIQTCIRLLAPGGYLIFLSTPNSNSPYYRRFKTLPFLTPHANFLIPSDIMMKNALQNFGLEVVDIRYPYIGGPYARPVRDHLLYFLSFFGVKRKFPFWRSAMEIYGRKPVSK
jgi:2-polyprenyl-3-methyl-5-hydroxy-6-metoxy-1,4-benzoquinol methylase